jgi:broad specificity phosphatase PhoE
LSTIFIISHPEVTIEPDKPVPEWSLSAAGRERMRRFSRNLAKKRVSSIWSSAETKAVEAASILAKRLKTPLRKSRLLGENDRTSTGFLPPSEFGAMADLFFGQPNISHRGWESAIDAQSRIVLAVKDCLSLSEPGHIAIITHGAVGTLLLCHALSVPIDRKWDQPFQGHFWTFERDTWAVSQSWKPIASRRND